MPHLMPHLMPDLMENAVFGRTDIAYMLGNLLPGFCSDIIDQLNFLKNCHRFLIEQARVSIDSLQQVFTWVSATPAESMWTKGSMHSTNSNKN